DHAERRILVEHLEVVRLGVRVHHADDRAGDVLDRAAVEVLWLHPATGPTPGAVGAVVLEAAPDPAVWGARGDDGVQLGGRRPGGIQPGLQHTACDPGDLGLGQQGLHRV